MKKQFGTAAIILCLLLCSCGAKEQGVPLETGAQGTETAEETTAAEQEKTYILRDIPMPDAKQELEQILPEGAENYRLFCGLAGESVYCLSEGYPQVGSYEKANFYVQKLAAPYEKWETFTLEAEEYFPEEIPTVRKAYLTADGTLKILFGTENGNYVAEWKENQDFQVRELPIDADLGEIFENHLFANWYDGNEDGQFLWNEEKMLLYDENGTGQTTALDKTGALMMQATENPFSGELYFMGCNSDCWTLLDGAVNIEDGGFGIWSADRETPVFAAKNTQDTKSEQMGCMLADDKSGSVAFSSEKEGYLCNQMGIYCFSMENGSRERIFDFNEAGMGPGMTAPIRQMDASVGRDGSLYIRCEYIDGKSWFAKLEEQTQADRKKLELAVIGADAYLKKAVTDYNKQSDKYEVILRECEKNTDAEDYRNRIMAELSAGKGPDMMNQSVLDTQVGAKKGYLLELTEQFGEYRQNMFSKALDMGKAGDKYYGIPYSFQVQSLTADKKVVGDRTGWTLEEAMECMEQSGARTFMANVDGDYLYLYLGLLTQNPAFVDWENGISHLNEKPALDLLEFTARYSQKPEEETESAQLLASGESLTKIEYLVTPQTNRYLEEYMQGREVYIGFPTEDGRGGHLLTGNVLGINQNSTCKDGAVDFIEYLLSEEQQTYLADSMREEKALGGYPVMQKMLESAFGKSNLRDIVWNGEVFDQSGTEEIWNILLEETGAYRTGDKTAQEVMDVVHNRVQLYLDER